VSGLWVSLNHNSHGDVVVIRHILGLISVSLEDGVEGIVTNNLSEALKGNGLDGVEVVKSVNLEVNGLDLINWDINESWVGGLNSGVNLNEVGGSWGVWSNLGDEFWGGDLNGGIFVMVLVLVVLLVMALVAFFTSSSAALFKVSFLSLVDHLGFANKGLNGGVDHVLDLALRHGFGTFSNGGKSLLDGS